MASRQNLIPNCELFQPSHTHAGVECSSLAVSGVPKCPQLLSWACEWILKPDILSSPGSVLTCILYPKRCKRKQTSVQPCPHQSNAKSTEHADMTEHAKITVFLHQCSSLTTTLSHIKNCVSRTPVLRKNNTTVLHKTPVLHITVVWFQICLK